MVSSLTLAIMLNIVAVLALAGAVWLSLRGVGTIAAVKSDLLVLSTAVERADERITREVKARSGAAGAAERLEAKSLEEEARGYLQDGAAPVIPLRRPSPLRRRI